MATISSKTSAARNQTWKARIQCARKFFARITDDQVKYDVVDGYETLMELVK